MSFNGCYQGTFEIIWRINSKNDLGYGGPWLAKNHLNPNVKPLRNYEILNYVVRTNLNFFQSCSQIENRKKISSNPFSI